MIVRMVLALVVISTSALAALAERRHHHQAPYAGQENREISSLSGSDVADLLAGRGWGLAKPAELNGYPGPAHVLELGDRLNLTPKQRAEVQQVFDRMAERAREVGAQYVEAERLLDDAFKRHEVNEDLLADRLAKAEALRAELRRVHLVAHLETTPILTHQQRHSYISLRGYNNHGADHHRTPKAH